MLAPALLMGIMAWGMWRARYWAVLGFQLLLVFLIFSAVFGLLVQAASVAQFAATLVLLAVSGDLLLLHGQGDGADPDARAQVAALIVSIESARWLTLST